MLGLIAYLMISCILSLAIIRHDDMARGEPDSAVIVIFLVGIIIAPITLIFFTSKLLAAGIRKIVEK